MSCPALLTSTGATMGVGVLARYGDDDLGRWISLTRGNGVVTSYGFDAISRLSEMDLQVISLLLLTGSSTTNPETLLLKVLDI